MMAKNFDHFMVFSLASALLSGCASTPKEQAAAPVQDMQPSCGAEQYASYVGQFATDALIAQITASRGDKPMRVVKPGMAVTMDYRPDRLNVQVDEDGKIVRFTCT